MARLLQNKVAESKMTLPVMVVFSLVVWLLSGLTKGAWWPQFASFVVTTYLMIELNNHNALIRIYSRTVSSAFLLLSCVACFLFPSLQGAVLQLAWVAAYLILFHSYQNQEAAGPSFYAFCFLGIGSLAFVQLLWFVPLFWLLMATHLQMLSWRTLFASILGLATPYWFVGCWLFYQDNVGYLVSHLCSLANFQPVGDFAGVTASQVVTFLFVVACLITGTVHYVRTSYHDSIRVRQLYGVFMWMDLFCIVFMLLQPQHYGVLMRVMIVNTAPMIAHFVSLTRTRVTNVAFYLVCVTALVLTAYNLWMSSSLF